KATKPAKKKQLAKTSKAKGLTVLSEVALIEAEQMKLATKRSMIQTHSFHARGSGADEGTGDNDDKEEEGSDLRVQTPSHYESTDDEESDEVTQGGNVEREEVNEEINKEEEVNELYRNVNVNLEGRDIEMTDAPQTNVPGTQVTEDTHVIMTTATPEVQQQSSSISPSFISNMLNPNPDIGIDSILNQNIESTSLVDVPVLQLLKCLLLLQQHFLHHPLLSSNLCNKHLVKSIEDEISVFKQTTQFAEAVSLIPCIEQVKEQVKAQVSKILLKIEKSVNEQLKAEVLTRSSNESKTSHAVAANLSELELKKILIEKMERNKHRDDEDEDEEPSAGTNRGSKRRRARKEHESTSATKEKTSKSLGKSKEGSKSHLTSTGKSAQAEEPIHADKDLEEPAHQEFDTGFTEDQSVEEITQLPDWFQKPTKPPTPDRDWNKTLPDAHGQIQPWINNLA
ncbi:hypothetical protein Tco_1452326, partial [Tanacetum coccineum]